MDSRIDRFDEDLAPARERQRARGEICASFALAGARTEAARLFETGGLRLRFPRAGAECEAVVVNTGGGMAGGDRARIDFALAPGARVIATTQAAEKIYRAEGAGAEVAVRLVVEAGAALVWAPQETLLFDRARLSRRLEADVAADASLLIVEASVFGRLAHGETRIDAALHDDWRIRREGRLIFAEAVRLENAAATLDRPAVGRGARAIATLVVGGSARPDPARRTARRARRGGRGPRRIVGGRGRRRRRRADRPRAFVVARPASRRDRQRDARLARSRGAAGVAVENDRQLAVLPRDCRRGR